ncbi:1-phosphofructokinase [Shimazuella sp. AN120528]|uniref:1-phosphofructokinase n=1 Tax=Shimazuella soli TaxID=1892854 RepID=UPI001F10F89B|nr:1-phosphofructokinase [Shimazuella soli]MCH5584906.1 1-phosphofructokinase [Shimazuella soli]
MMRIATVSLNPAVDQTITIEKLYIGQKNVAMNTRYDFGGKGINVARVLAHFDIQPTATGWLSREAEQYEKKLHDMGIHSSFVFTNQPIRTNVKVLEQHSGKMTELNEAGFPISGKEKDQFIKHYIGLLSEVDVVILAGSLPPGIDPAFYSFLIEQANNHQVLTFLDTNGHLLKYASKSLPYAIKPNQEELEEYLGYKVQKEQDVIEAGLSLIDQGISLVSISLGAKGAYFFKQGQVVKSKPPHIEVKSAVGAGDSMFAGMVISVMNSWELEKIARFSTALGSATASKAGTQLGTPEDVDKLLDLVEVEGVNGR